MNSLSTWALTELVTYGPPILFLVAYAGSLGIPFPVSLVVIAAGAFARQGVIDWRLALLACAAGSILADSSEYWLGRAAEGWLERHFGQQAFWLSAQATFRRQGGWAILLTRFWLTTLAPAINLIAGGRYSFRRFLLFDASGELIWALLYGGLGYLFGGAWPLISQVMSDFTGLSLGLVALGVGVYVLVGRRKKAKPAAKTPAAAVEIAANRPAAPVAVEVDPPDDLPPRDRID